MTSEVRIRCIVVVVVVFVVVAVDDPLPLSSGQDVFGEFLVVVVAGDLDVDNLGRVVPLPHGQDGLEVGMLLELLSLVLGHGAALVLQRSLAGDAQRVVVLRGPDRKINQLLIKNLN